MKIKCRKMKFNNLILSLLYVGTLYKICQLSYTHLAVFRARYITLYYLYFIIYNIYNIICFILYFLYNYDFYVCIVFY